MVVVSAVSSMSSLLFAMGAGFASVVEVHGVSLGVWICGQKEVKI